MKEKRLYIAYSYFNFYESIILSYERRYIEKAIIVLLKLPTDDSDYKWLFDYLNIFDFISIQIIDSNNYKVLYKYLLSIKNFIKKDKVYLATEYNYQVNFFVQFFLSRNVEVLGDGAGLIWDEDNNDTLKTKLKYLPFQLLFKFKSPLILRKTVKRDFFQKNFEFYKNKYKNLPIENECWIFGTSIPFVKPYSLDYYSDISKEFFQNGAWIDKDYILWMENLVNSLNKYKIMHRYYPHPKEPQSDFHNVNFTNKDTYSEFLPFKFGYLPKYIFALSTTAFNYLTIVKNINKNIKIYVLTQTDRIDDIYKSYGATIYYPGKTFLDLK